MSNLNQRDKTSMHNPKASHSKIARKQQRLYRIVSSKVIVISCILGLIALVAISHNFDGTIKASANVKGAEFVMTRCPVEQ